MSTFNKALLGILGALIVVNILPFGGFITFVLMAAIIGIPVVGYLTLDPSQRKRLRERGRGQIGR
jgi:hypothetical protein